MLLEISRTTLPTPKNNVAQLSWHNSILAVRVEKHIIFYEFARNLECTSKKLELLTSDVPLIKDSPLDGLVPSKFTSPGVRNSDYTQLILDPSLWPHSKLLVDELVTVADIQWSSDLVINKHCILAVLNNVGNVNFLAKCRHTWKSVLDLSEMVKKIFLSMKNWNNIEKLTELKDFAYTLETNAIIWGPSVENGCLFATAQKKGNILFWLLESEQDTIKPQFCGDTCEVNVGEILYMAWIQKTSKEFLLICSNVLGQIYCYNCLLNNNEIKVTKVTCLWSYKDRMISKYIKHLVGDDKFVLFLNKHRHLLVQIIDNTGELLMQHFENINDYRITDIAADENGVFVTTVNFKVYKINLVILENLNSLRFEAEPVCIENSNNYSTYDLQAMDLSSNSVIWALAAKDRKILHRQRVHKAIEIIFFADIKTSETALLLGNTTRVLTNFWDCIELLRCKTMKLKALPPLNFNHFFQEADKDIYKLKLYLIFLQFYLNLEYQLKNKSRKQMPENSVENVKEKILALHACQLLNELYEHHKDNGTMMDEFYLKSFMGAKKYLNYYCEKYGREVFDFVMQEVYEFTSVEDVVECQNCDETLEGFSCKNGHLNMFCSLTFTPIDGMLGYLSCQVCGCTFRTELYGNNLKCIFCDL